MAQTETSSLDELLLRTRLGEAGVINQGKDEFTNIGVARLALVRLIAAGFATEEILEVANTHRELTLRESAELDEEILNAKVDQIDLKQRAEAKLKAEEKYTDLYRGLIVDAIESLEFPPNYVLADPEQLISTGDNAVLLVKVFALFTALHADEERKTLHDLLIETQSKVFLDDNHKRQLFRETIEYLRRNGDLMRVFEEKFRAETDELSRKLLTAASDEDAAPFALQMVLLNGYMGSGFAIQSVAEGQE